MEQIQNEIVAGSLQELKTWSAPQLIEADIAEMTEFGLSAGDDGNGSSTLS